MHRLAPRRRPPPPVRLVLEGVTGAGKSSVIAALEAAGQLPAGFVPEDETFGDAMLEVGQPGFRRRLTAVCARLDAARTEEILLERFHLSYFAQDATWAPYRVFDDWLLARGFSIVVLAISEERLRERSLFRREFGGADWQGFVPHFGNEANALEALRTSQARRIEALEKSRVRSLVVNTDSEDWTSIAAQILAFAAR